LHNAIPLWIFSDNEGYLDLWIMWCEISAGEKQIFSTLKSMLVLSLLSIVLVFGVGSAYAWDGRINLELISHRFDE